MQDLSRYSPELRDVISRPQEKFTRIMWWMISGTVAALLLAGVLIQSPDILTADAKVSSSTPPTVLKAAVTGTVEAVSPSVPGTAAPGEYLAVIASPGSWTDIRYALEAARTNGAFTEPPGVNPDGTIPAESLAAAARTDDLILGELTGAYHEWTDAQAQYARLSREDNEYFDRIRNFEKRAEYDRKDIANLQKSLKASRRQLSVRKEQHSADSALLASDDILSSEYQGTLLSMLSAEQSLLNAESSLNAKKRSLSENAYQAESVRKEYQEALTAARSRVLSAYGEFCAQGDAWEQRHALIAAEGGITEWATPVSPGDRVEAGTPLINVIHSGPSCKATAVLPARGAGKAAAGQPVRIKLEAYPFTEYGYLEGTVRSININTIDRNYLVQIDLPQGTTSSAGKTLDFAETLYGTAEIITRKRPLISKVFYRIYDILAGETAAGADLPSPEEQEPALN